MGNVGDIWMRSHLPILFLGVLSYQRFPRRLPILLTAHPHARSSQPWLVRKAHWLSLTPAATFEFARSKMMDVTKNCIIYNINIYIYIYLHIHIYICLYIQNSSYLSVYDASILLSKSPRNALQLACTALGELGQSAATRGNPEIARRRKPFILMEFPI